MYWGEFRAYVNSFLVLLFFLTFNLISGNGFGFWENTGRSLLVASMIMVSVALVLGPLSRVFPKKFSHDLLYRKPVAYAGTLFALLYFGIAAVGAYKLDFLFMFSAQNPDFLAWVFWVLGLAVLCGLAIASLPHYLERIGFGNWKSLQPIGYAALVFMLIHLSFLRSGYFLTTVSGKTVFLFGVVALLMKAIAVILGLGKRHSRHEVEVLMREH
ncbi:Uncharacterised protein [uncultured archaeon]|nr:Uncharacterised protein [uncultured archaeon]